jgi:glycerol-3-phosphate dehydrogenase (NAD(P)+)
MSHIVCATSPGQQAGKSISGVQYEQERLWSMDKIGIIGSGAWGTALATVACRAGRTVSLWARKAQVAAHINTDHENPLYLPGVTLDAALRAHTDLATVAQADALVLVVPAQFFRAMAESLAAHIRADMPLLICAKGIECETGALMADVLGDALPGRPVAVLSGPTFAAEVARRLPAAATLACADPDLGAALVAALATPRFRIYRSEDVVGVEVGGAIKNVLAIACGIVEGHGLGDNARAAIITRGLAEMARLSSARGGRPETLMGLSGLGDLTLTCNAMQSRNFSLGVALGQGRSLREILDERRAVTEGVATAKAVTALAARLGIDMPICRAVDQVINRGVSIDATITELLARPVGVDSPLDEGPENSGNL